MPARPHDVCPTSDGEPSPLYSHRASQISRIFRSPCSGYISLPPLLPDNTRPASAPANVPNTSSARGFVRTIELLLLDSWPVLFSLIWTAMSLAISPTPHNCRCLNPEGR